MSIQCEKGCSGYFEDYPNKYLSPKSSKPMTDLDIDDFERIGYIYEFMNTEDPIRVINATCLIKDESFRKVVIYSLGQSDLLSQKYIDEDGNQFDPNKALILSFKTAKGLMGLATNNFVKFLDRSNMRMLVSSISKLYNGETEEKKLILMDDYITSVTTLLTSEVGAQSYEPETRVQILKKVNNLTTNKPE